MFEVEKNFDIDSSKLNKLLENAEFISEKTFTDVYFDNKAYELTTSDRWLRKRDRVFEFKVVQFDGNADNNFFDHYKEITNHNEIRRELGIKGKGSLVEDLANAGYKPFAKVITTRKKYKMDEFTIDIDEMDFGFNTCEIELMVGSKAEMQKAQEKIIEFAKKHGLPLKPANGKVIEYLKRKNKAHYGALLKAGVVRKP